ncbi:MAG: hypothetical protein PVJ51_04820 [Acidobacteriota bacterium]|jgi:glycogen debranching enzyme
MLRWLAVVIVAAMSVQPLPATTTMPQGAAPGTTITRFAFDPSPIALSGDAQGSRYLEASGREAAFLGHENGSFEAWAYPLKVLHDFELGFGVAAYNEPIPGADLISRVTVRPESSTIRYAHSAFTADATWFVPLHEAGGMVLLDIDASEPVTVRVRFRTDLKPMWPAGLGGQYSYWDDSVKAFVIGEGSGQHAALIGSPLGLQPPTQPAHNLPDAPSEFSILVTPEAASAGLVPIVIAASVEGLDDARATYDRLLTGTEALYRESAAHYRDLREEMVSVEAPDERIGLALEWGKVALDKGYVCNPHLGCGLVAGLGPSGITERPGFGWFFGGDAFMNMWAMTAYGDFETVRNSLEFLRERQRDDGKMMHELSQGAHYIDWFGDYPYAYYHADTTPLYISAVRDYVRISGDTELARDFWPSIKLAYEYCASTDDDGDGLMDNTLAGLAAVETGALRSSEVLTDVYLAAAWATAADATAELALIAGDEAFGHAAADAALKAVDTANARFLDDDDRQIYFAILRDGTGQAEASVWTAWGMWRDVFDAGRPAVEGTLDTLGADWGTRMLSRDSALYEPLSYNNGAIWPFLTGFAILGLYEQGRAPAAWAYLDGTADLTFIDGRGYITELLSGDRLQPIDAAVPHQLFATFGYVAGLLRGMVGLRADALIDGNGAVTTGGLRLRPQLPAGWDWLRVHNLRFRDTRFDLDIERNDTSITATVRAAHAGPLPLTVDLTLPVGARPTGPEIESLITAGADTTPRQRGVRVTWSPQPQNGSDTVRIDHDGGIAIRPLHEPLRLGDTPRRLRVIDTWIDGDAYTARLEGRAGRTYRVELETPLEPVSVSNATELARDGDKLLLEVSFPPGDGDWVTLDLVVHRGDGRDDEPR